MFIGFIVFSYPQDEKVIRRNENVPQGCKAEMTSAAVTAAPATGAATAATTGGNATLSGRKSGQVVQISVAVQTANRTDGTDAQLLIT